jgi:hypothetical protein
MEDEVQSSPSTEEVMGSLGVDSQGSDPDNSGEEAPKDDLPLVAKERLGRQEKRHRKEIRALQDQMQDLYAKLGNQQESYSPPMNENSSMPSTEDERIQRAVSLALRHREEQEQKAKSAEQMVRVQQHYQDLQNDLDNGIDKYEDFDEVVKGQDVPFTNAMRDASLLIPRHMRADVLYKLGKNKEELRRISQLHPFDQAQEVMKLGFALANGDTKASSNPSNSKIMNSVKGNPQTSHSAVSQRATASDIRSRMKAGTWK